MEDKASIEQQLLYKLASLEASLTSNFRRIDEKMDRFQTEFHDRHTESAAEFARLAASVDSRFALKRSRIDALEHKVSEQNHAIRNDLTKFICAEIERTGDKASARDEATDVRVDKLETWKTEVVTKVSILGSAAFFLWAAFGQYVQNFFMKVL